MIQFIKILRYETKPPSGDVFDYLCGVTTQHIDPPTASFGELMLNADVIFHSNLRRAKECIHIAPSIKYIASSFLNEVPFDLRDICPREEWEHEGSVAVRRKFKQAFIEDGLLIKRSELFREIEMTVAACRREEKTSKVAIVSHSFRLKLIEAFLVTGGDIRENPLLIHRFIHDEKKTYEFGGGFTLDNLTLLD